MSFEQYIQYLALIVTVISGPLVIMQALQSAKAVSHHQNAPRLFRLIRLRQFVEHPNLWKKLMWASIGVAVVAILLVVFIIVLFVINRTQVVINIELILSFILVIGLPLFLLLDTCSTERRIRKNESSRVFKSTGLEMEADYDNMLVRSLQVLVDMGATIDNFDSDIGRIECHLAGSRICIEISLMDNGHYNLVVSSDSTLPSTRFDFGRNRKNVDEFSKRLLGLR